MPFDKKAWRLSNIDKIRSQNREAMRRFRLRHADKLRLKDQERYPLPKRQKGFTESRIKARYGITLAQRAQMEIDQDRQCYICKTVPDKGLVIDHDHSNGKVRALLCSSCNLLIGLLETRKHLLEDAHKYIQTFKDKHNEQRA